MSAASASINTFCRRWFWWFTAIHLLLWIVMPTWLRYALPHDTIEGALWGQHLQWGYDKNPWLNAWLTRLGWIMGGTSGAGIYALSSLFVGISFWSVWQLGQKILSPVYALIGVLLLEGCINYTLVPQSFNDNLLELGLWPLGFFCFYQALTQQRIRYWLATGIVMGLAMMAKYYSAIPLIVMLGLLLAQKKGHESFRHAGIYIGLLGFVLVVLPHVIWLFQHQFLTVQYALNRTDNSPHSWWRLHFYYPLNFAFAQLIDVVALPILLLFFYLPSSKNNVIAERKKLSAFDQQFLLSVALGPYILTVVLAIVFGWRLYNEWGVPLVSLAGLLMVACVQPKITLTQLRRFVALIFVVMLLWAAGYAAGLFLDKRHKHSDNYPAQDIANYVEEQWWTRYHKPLKYVAGSRYIAGYIAFYAKDHPGVYVEWNDQFSPWIDVNNLKKYGAVFIQDNYYGTTVFGLHPDTNNGTQFPKEILQRFPDLQVMLMQYFYWHRAGDKLPPIPVLIGFLPPQTKSLSQHRTQ